MEKSIKRTLMSNNGRLSAKLDLLDDKENHISSHHHSSIGHSNMTAGHHHHNHQKSTLLFNRMSMSVRGGRYDEREDILKLKTELEHWENAYNRLKMSHEKDIAILEEKIGRSDIQIQRLLKEKSNLNSTNSSKERELNDLLSKIDGLTVNLEKSEKHSLSLQERLAKIQPLQKKLEELERENNRLKSMQIKKGADSEKLSKEKEELEKKIQQVSFELQQMQSEHDHLATQLHSIKEAYAQLKNDSENNTFQAEEQLRFVNRQIQELQSKHKEELNNLKYEQNTTSSVWQQKSMALEKQLVHLKSELASMETTKHQLQALLQQERHAKELLNKTLDKDVTALNADRDAVITELTQLKDSYAALQNHFEEKQEYFENLLAEKDESLVQSSSSLAAAEGKLNELNVNLETMTHYRSDFEEASHQIIDLKQQVLQMENLVQDKNRLTELAEQETEKLQMQYEEMFNKYSEFEFLVSELHGKQSQDDNTSNSDSDLNPFSRNTLELQLEVFQSSLAKVHIDRLQKFVQSCQNSELIWMQSKSHLDREMETLAFQLQKTQESKTQMEADHTHQTRELESEIEKLTSKLHALESERMVYEAQLGESNHTLNKKIQSLEEQNLSLMEELESARLHHTTRLETVEIQLEQLKEELCQKQQTFEKELQEWKDFGSAQEDCISVLKKDFDDLKLTVTQKETENSELIENINKLKDGKINILQDKKRISSDLASLEQELKRIEKLKSDEIASLQSQLGSIIAEKESMKEQLNALSSDLTNKESWMKSKIEDLSIENEELQKELESLRQELEGTHFTLKEKDETICSLQRIVQGKEENVQQHKLKNQELENKIAGFLRTNQTLSLQKGQLENTLASIEEQVEQLKTKFVSKEREFSDLMSQKSTVESKLDELSEHCSQLEQALAEKEEICDELSNDKHHLKTELEKFKNATTVLFSEVQQNLEAKQSELAVKNAKLKDLVQSVKEKQTQIETLSSELATMTENKNHLEYTLIHEKEVLQSSAEQEIESLKVHVEELSNRIDSLTHDLEEELHLKEALASDLVVSEETIVQLKSELQSLSETKEQQTVSSNNLIQQQQNKLNYLENQVKKLNLELQEKQQALILEQDHFAANQVAQTDKLFQLESKWKIELETQVAKLNKDLAVTEETLKQKTEESEIERQEMLENASALESKYQEERQQMQIMLNEQLSQAEETLDMLKKQSETEKQVLVQQIENLKAKTVEERQVLEESFKNKVSNVQQEFQTYKDEVEQEKTELLQQLDELADFVSNERERSGQVEKNHAEEMQMINEEVIMLQQTVKGLEQTNALIVNEKRSQKIKLEEENHLLQSKLLELTSHSESVCKQYNDIRDSVEQQADRVLALTREKRDLEHVLKNNEVKYANELASRDIQLKFLEEKLREKTNELERNKDILVHGDQMRKELRQLKSQLKNQQIGTSSIGGKNGSTSTTVEELSRQMVEEKQLYERQIGEMVSQIEDYQKKMEQFQHAIQAAENSRLKLEQSYQSKLKSIEASEKLANSEYKKLVNMNAELMGHQNARQKIKLISQMREENFELKKEKEDWSSQNKSLKNRLMELERELDSYKAVKRSEKSMLGAHVSIKKIMNRGSNKSGQVLKSLQPNQSILNTSMLLTGAAGDDNSYYFDSMDKEN